MVELIVIKRDGGDIKTFRRKYIPLSLY